MPYYRVRRKRKGKVPNEKRSKAARRARGKGSTFERFVATWLSEWWGGRFRRSPKSGGWDETKRFDLCPMDARAMAFPCGVECKCQEVLSLRAILQSRSNPNLKSWWEQVSGHARDSNQIPMLIAKKNFFPPIIGLPFDLPLTPKLVARVGNERVFLFDLALFEKYFTPKRFAKVCRIYQKRKRGR